VQDLLVPMGLTRKVATGLSGDFVKLAADLSSFSNVPIADAFTAIRAGIVGEFEPLRRLGVTLSVAKIEQEAMRMGLIKTKAELTPAIKTQVVYAEAVKQSADAMRDTIRTSDSYANQVRKLQANIEDFKVELGQELLPIAKEYVGKLNEWIAANKELITLKVHEVLDKTATSMNKIVDVYNKLPEGVIGATGVGILGRWFFGSWKPALLLAWIYDANRRMDKFVANMNKGNDALNQMASSHGVNDTAAYLKKLGENAEKSGEQIEVAMLDASDAFVKLQKTKEDYRDREQDNLIIEPTDEYTKMVEQKFETMYGEATETLDELSEFTKQAYRNMESYAGDFFFDIMKGNYDNLLDSFLDMTRRMVAEWLAAQAMIGLFGSEFGKGGPLGGFIGSAVSFLNPFKMAQGGMINEPVFGVGASGRSYMFGESGPDGASGRSYMFGESGPEAVVPLGSSSNSMGGITINMPIDARGSDAGVEARLQRLVPQIAAQTKVATLEAIRRGGYAREVVRG